MMKRPPVGVVRAAVEWEAIARGAQRVSFPTFLRPVLSWHTAGTRLGDDVTTATEPFVMQALERRSRHLGPQSGLARATESCSAALNVVSTMQRAGSEVTTALGYVGVDNAKAWQVAQWFVNNTRGGKGCVDLLRRIHHAVSDDLTVAIDELRPFWDKVAETPGVSKVLIEAMGGSMQDLNPAPPSVFAEVLPTR